jgi:hypothetical protein
MKRKLEKFKTFAEAEKADREFYRKLTGDQRLQILLELLAPLQGDGRIDRSVVRKRKLG